MNFESDRAPNFVTFFIKSVVFEKRMYCIETSPFGIDGGL